MSWGVKKHEKRSNNCDPCAEKHCKDVVTNRAKLRATRLDIVVAAPLFSQLAPANASCLKKSVLSALVGDLILLDTEAYSLISKSFIPIRGETCFI